jgi:type IV fimbrial biogenesis protein FimT
MSTSRRQGGFTIIEFLVVFAIFGIMLAVGVPSLFEYMRNARLREAGNTVLGEAIFARNEAIKRNTRVRLSFSTDTVTVSDITGGVTTQIRTRTLPPPVAASAASSIDFLSAGRPPLGSNLVISFLHGSDACSADVRCPQLRVNSGGSSCVKVLNVTVTPDPCP